MSFLKGVIINAFFPFFFIWRTYILKLTVLHEYQDSFHSSESYKSTSSVVLIQVDYANRFFNLFMRFVDRSDTRWYSSSCRP